MRTRLISALTLTTVLAACGGASDQGSAEPAPQPTETYTMAEVAENDGPDSCWAAIDGTVYELTSWIQQHPGSAGSIEAICGQDATEVFTNRHAGSRQAEEALAQMAIGTLQG